MPVVIGSPHIETMREVQVPVTQGTASEQNCTHCRAGAPALAAQNDPPRQGVVLKPRAG